MYNIIDIGKGREKLKRIRLLTKEASDLIQEIKEDTEIESGVVDINNLARKIYQVRGYIDQIEEVTGFSWDNIQRKVSVEE